jgi:hypothetical protein
VATPARDVPIEGDLGGQLVLFGVPTGDLSEAIVPTDLSPRANGRPPSLTLGEAARIMREAVKDKSYRSTPVGLEVAHFIRWFRNEYGATAETLRDYEAILAKLAIDHADLELAAFEPPHGTTRLRDFIDGRWGDAAPRTRKKVRAVLMSFFKWAQAEFKLQGNPRLRPRAAAPSRARQGRQDRARQRSSARRSPNSRCDAIRRSTCCTRRSAARRGR